MKSNIDSAAGKVQCSCMGTTYKKHECVAKNKHVLFTLFPISSHLAEGLFSFVCRRGFYENRPGGYEIVEVTGLYWHFVDLVWVFIFAFFYLW